MIYDKRVEKGTNVVNEQYNYSEFIMRVQYSSFTTTGTESLYAQEVAKISSTKRSLTGGIRTHDPHLNSCMFTTTGIWALTK